MPAVATFPRYIPLSEAATQLNIGLAKLHDMATLGKIEAIQLPDGGLAVNEQVIKKTLRKEDLPEYKKHEHLDGKEVGINEGAINYEVPYTTLYRWYKKGLIERLGKKGQKVLLDEADVAYCAEIYHDRGTQGRKIFNADGTPYQPKTGPLSRVVA